MSFKKVHGGYLAESFNTRSLIPRMSNAFFLLPRVSTVGLLDVLLGVRLLWRRVRQRGEAYSLGV